MFTSVILDARMTGLRLPRQLSALQRAMRRWPGRIEMLVVDDTGDPRLPKLAQRYGARLQPSEGTPLGDRLNSAAAHSQGEVLIFPAPGAPLPLPWLQAVAESSERHQWDVAVLPGQPSGRFTRLRQWFQRQLSADSLCVSRAWFERIGGFDPALDLDAVADLLERLRACQAKVEVSAP